jgi:hypothetical protein
MAATFLAHKELQVSDSDVAGVGARLLLWGMYNSKADAHKGERAYLGTDTS